MKRNPFILSAICCFALALIICAPALGADSVFAGTDSIKVVSPAFVPGANYVMLSAPAMAVRSVLLQHSIKQRELLPFVRSEPREVPPFPVVLNREVRRYVDAFLARPAGLRLCFTRSRPYMAQMVRVLESYGLPADLVYLAFAESRFTQAGDGPWQLTKATARQYGLRVDRYVDERRDPIKSTRAAAEYLADLHQETHDWRFTLIGWNAGEVAIDRLWTLRGASYQDLVRHLEPQTRALLDRFMAVAFIAHNALGSGIRPISSSRPPAYHSVRVHGGAPLRHVAQNVGSTVARLRKLNPALLSDRVPPNVTSYPVRVPDKARTEVSAY
jgi:peptidoglycan lytic transglycosylase D